MLTVCFILYFIMVSHSWTKLKCYRCLRVVLIMYPLYYTTVCEIQIVHDSLSAILFRFRNILDMVSVDSRTRYTQHSAQHQNPFSLFPFFFFFFLFFFSFFVYVRRPHCKLDWYICTILLTMYTLFYLTV